MAIDDITVTPEELPPIQEEAEWKDHLPGLLTDVIIIGGGDARGAANFQARVLDARTRWLKKVLEDVQKNGVGGVILKGVLQTEQELAAIPTEGLLIGTAYFLDFEMRMWNGTEWETSGSLRGERGINVLGVWPNAVPLPEFTQNRVGDAYIWQNDIWVLVPDFDYDNPDPEPGEELPPIWEALGIRGPAGASTFELWKTIPGNENKTLAQFMAAQKGANGDNHYQTWLTMPGNTGKSMAEWIEDTRGIQGEKGDPRAAFTVKGGRPSIDQLPFPGKEEEAYYVGIDLYVWVDTDNDYFLVPGVKGKSAFDDWRDSNPANKEKTIEDFLATLVSTEPGPKGEPGKNLYIKGTVPNKDVLQTLPTPKDQDAYVTQDESHLWMYIVNTWTDLGIFRGANGRNIIVTGSVAELEDLPTTATEQDVYSVEDINTLYAFVGGRWISLGKFQGPAGKDSNVAGPEGKPGTNVVLKGAVGSVQDLPTSPAPEEQDAWSVRDENSIHMFIKGAWVNLGKFRGENGTNGTNGVNIIIKGAVERAINLPTNAAEQDVYSVTVENALYARISNNWVNLGTFKGADGTNGTNGTNGKNGTDGKDGKSTQIIKILTPDDQTPPPLDAETQGKSYLDLDKVVWINVNGDAWVEAGPFSGGPGEQGPIGPPLKPRGTVATVTALPPPWERENGDLWFTADTKLGYVVVDGEWSAPIDIMGPTGKTGNDGLPGALMPILGMYASMAALTAAHPTGAKGDAYLIITGEQSRDLVIWNPTTSAWQNTGPAGIVGPPGPPGEDSKVPGAKGEKGSQWLILPEGTDQPSNAFNGNPGDWAVTKNLRVWYKTVDRGWIFWNWLVAGDVNSPLLSQGKVVRYGDAWVPETIVEVPSPEADAWYGRKKKADSEDETEWSKIIFPKGIEDLTVKDGKQMVRLFVEGALEPVWVEMVAVQDPTGSVSGKYFVRKADSKSWTEIKLAPSDGKVYMSKDGDWIPFDRYDLLIKAVSTTYTIDPTKENFVKLTNTAATAKQITLNNGPGATRGMVVILEVVGVTGAVTYGGTNIKWADNTIPTLSGTKTLITFTWDGEIWIGAKGPALLT